MPTKSYYLNTAKIRNIIEERYGSIHSFSIRNGFRGSEFNKKLREGCVTEYMARRIADALGVGVSDICGIPKVEKPYWWTSDHEHPVDVEFCKKCWIWNGYSNCCDYLERKGCLRPDNTIVVHGKGKKNTCSVRELKTDKHKYNGSYQNSAQW